MTAALPAVATAARAGTSTTAARPPGPRTAAAVAHLSVSGRHLASLPRLVAALAAVKVAAAEANGRTGELPADVAAAIARAARDLPRLAVDDPAQLPVDPLGGGGWIGVHHNVNEVVASLAGDALGRAVDPVLDVARSQSTADVCHTAGRLAILDALDATLAALDATSAAWARLADRGGEHPTLARTCLQDACEVPAALLPSGAGSALDRARRRLVAAGEPLHEITLGATVVGTGAGATPEYRARVVRELTAVTGRPLSAHPTPASALQHGDDLVALAHATSEVATVLRRAASDLRWLSAGPNGGAAEVRFDPVVEGSAFFAGKVNPVVAETVVLGALQVDTLLGGVHRASAAAELHLHVYENLSVVALLDALELLERTAARAAELADATTFDHQRGAALASTARSRHGER